MKMSFALIPMMFFFSILFISCQTKQEPERLEGERVLDHKETLIDSIQEMPNVERRDKNHQGRFVTIDDSISIYVIEKGEGIPLILVNGGPGKSCHSFIPHFDKAEEFAKVIYYEPRGVGKSDWNPGDRYSSNQLVEDLEKIRVELGIDKWVMAGWSYGGLAAQYYALQNPDNLLGLVLINSSYSASYSFGNGYIPNYLSEGERKRIGEIYRSNDNKKFPEHSDEVSLESMQQMIYNGYLNGDWKRENYYKPSKEEIAEFVLYDMLHDANYRNQINTDAYTIYLNDMFENFKKPVLIYYGKHDMTYNTNLAENMKSEFQNSQLIIMEHSSHHPFIEQPKLFFAELEKFVSNLN